MKKFLLAIMLLSATFVSHAARPKSSAPASTTAPTAVEASANAAATPADSLASDSLVTIQPADESTTFTSVCVDQDGDYIIEGIPYSLTREARMERQWIQKDIQDFAIIVLFTAACIALVWMLLRYLRQRNLDRLNIIGKSLELDRPLPKEFFMSSKANVRKLSGGIFWIGAGIATIAFFLAVGAPVWPVGIVLLAIGVAKIAGYFIAVQDSNNK